MQLTVSHSKVPGLQDSARPAMWSTLHSELGPSLLCGEQVIFSELAARASYLLSVNRWNYNLLSPGGVYD